MPRPTRAPPWTATDTSRRGNGSGMADISIPWGDETWTVALPAAWTVQQVAALAMPPAGDDWGERLAGALTRPEGSPPLAKLLAARPDGKIAVIVEDITRHSPVREILGIVFRELAHAKIPSERIEIVFATGMHPPLTAAQAAEKLGEELASGFRWRSNPWEKTDAYARVGTARDGKVGIDLWIDRGVADADLRILVSSVSPHLQAGFGGGYKMLLPGCGRLDSIRQLHLAGLQRGGGQMVGQPHTANRMRRLIDAAGEAVDARRGTSFGVQCVLDASSRPSAIAAGDVTACQRMLAKQCAAGCGVLIDSPADVVVTNAFPLDFDLWQSFKAVANTCWAVRDNGVLICLARCPGGANMPTLSLPVGPRWVRRAVRLMGADALAALLTRTVPRLAGDAAFFVRLALQMIQRVTVIMVSPALVESGASMVGLELLGDPAEAFAAADEILGSGNKRVIAFPAGGVTDPILRRQAAPG